MFKNHPLPLALQSLATDDEWNELDSLRNSGYNIRLDIFIDGPPLLHEIAYNRYTELITDLWSRLQRRLQTEEWTGIGFSPRHSLRPETIDPRLWGVLKLCSDLESVEGGGYHFVNVLISDTIPPQPRGGQSESAKLFSDLKVWLKKRVNEGPSPLVKDQTMDEATIAFKGRHIAPNLFRKAWSEAVPAEHRLKGRPKAKG